MSDPFVDPEPSLTTVPEEHQGRRTFAAMLIAACAVAVLALGFLLFQMVTRVVPPEEVAHRHFAWPSGYQAVRANDHGGRADVWLAPSGAIKPPGVAVRELLFYNSPGAGTRAPKKGTPLPLRLSADSGGRTLTVEYDSKSKEYHLWLVSP